MDNENIKVCPHCGGTASINANYSYRIRAYFVFVKCDVCGSQGKIYRSEENPGEIDWTNKPCQDAVAAWNMRYKEES